VTPTSLIHKGEQDPRVPKTPSLASVGSCQECANVVSVLSHVVTFATWSFSHSLATQIYALGTFFNTNNNRNSKMASATANEHPIAKALQPFVCGGSAATFASIVIHPMDLAKVSIFVLLLLPVLCFLL
jgi:hypothetical protein